MAELFMLIVVLEQTTLLLSLKSISPQGVVPWWDVRGFVSATDIASYTDGNQMGKCTCKIPK